MKTDGFHKKHILLKANIQVCAVIVVGFLLIFIANNKAEIAANKNNMERISILASESIRYRLGAIFAKPLNVSLTMAHDNLLIDYLSNERHIEDERFTQTIQDYLSAYKEKYDYDSVFLVSADTKRYYNYKGIDRILTQSNPENEWFYNFLESGLEYSLNVDNDEAAQDEITVFINARIISDDGTSLGIVGVGFRVDGLQRLLLEYAEISGVDIYLVNENENIEIAIDSTGWQPTNFFDTCGYKELKDEILKCKETGGMVTRWIPEKTWQNYIVTQYIPELSWHLIIEHNTSWFNEQMRRKFIENMLVLFIIGLSILSIITYTINRYNKRIIELVALAEHEKHVAIKRELTQKAETDGLTGLYNKTATEYYINQVLSYDSEKVFAFFILDIDNLKNINDTHGHAFGDLAISKFAASIKNQFRDDDIIGRIGGDEFVVLFPISNIEFMIKKVESLSKALDTDCSDGLVSYPISASIGAVIAPRDGDNFETLYRNADTALYQTKSRGKNSYTIFSQSE